MSNFAKNTVEGSPTNDCNWKAFLSILACTLPKVMNKAMIRMNFAHIFVKVNLFIISLADQNEVSLGEMK